MIDNPEQPASLGLLRQFILTTDTTCPKSEGGAELRFSSENRVKKNNIPFCEELTAVGSLGE